MSIYHKVFIGREGIKAATGGDEWPGGAWNIFAGKVANVVWPDLAGRVVHFFGSLYRVPTVKSGYFHAYARVFVGDAVGHFSVLSVHVGKEHGKGAWLKIGRRVRLVKAELTGHDSERKIDALLSQDAFGPTAGGENEAIAAKRFLIRLHDCPIFTRRNLQHWGVVQDGYPSCLGQTNVGQHTSRRA